MRVAKEYFRTFLLRGRRGTWINPRRNGEIVRRQIWFIPFPDGETLWIRFFSMIYTAIYIHQTYKIRRKEGAKVLAHVIFNNIICLTIVVRRGYYIAARRARTISIYSHACSNAFYVNINTPREWYTILYYILLSALRVIVKPFKKTVVKNI